MQLFSLPPQFKHYSGVFAQAAAHGAFLRHTDARAGEAGEGGSAQPCAYHSKGERSGGLERAENPSPTQQLLLSESVITVCNKSCTVMPFHVVFQKVIQLIMIMIDHIYFICLIMKEFDLAI